MSDEQKNRLAELRLKAEAELSDEEKTELEALVALENEEKAKVEKPA